MTPRRRLGAAIAPVAVALALVLGGCATAGAGQTAPEVPVTSGSPSAAAPSSTAPPSTAKLATPAQSQQIRFEPRQVVLPGGASAAVVPADTVGGILQVPEDVRKVGWWTGSAYAGDPFGATVIAGHVDSADQGLGFFSRLLRIRTGEQLTVTGDGHRASYRVTSTRLVAKDALTDDGAALDQTGDHRLVLITCAGAYVPADGGYESNLVIVATPVGAAR